jgi:hypothetical protein
MLKSRTRRATSFAVAATTSLLAALLAVAAPSASAAGDVTAPVIKANASAGFVVGSTLTAETWGSEPYYEAQMYFNYTVTDNLGAICGVTVSTVSGENTEQVVDQPVESYTATPYSGRFVGWMDEYSGQEGDSGGALYGWAVEATDCANNAVKRMVWSKPEILEENNYTVFEGDRGNITYAGNWSTVTCACASRGAMKKTSAKGASFTYTDYWNRDDHVGLVMAKGPGRGSAAVYIDGTKIATVNTYATTTQNRVIVYDKWMAAGTHTVRVVNLATSGHSRIDIDAVLNH